MSEVSREDLKTILLFCCHLARLDKNFHPFEKKILQRYAEAINLLDDERSALLEHEFSLVKNMAHLTGEDAKKLLIKTLCLVAAVDGYAHPGEISFIEKVRINSGVGFSPLPEGEWASYEEEVFKELE